MRNSAFHFFNKEQKLAIEQAISKAEKMTSGEIRVHLESMCRENVLDHAAHIFEKIGMFDTRDRNGVLFYVAIDDQRFAILGDSGINEKVPENFWDDIRDEMTQAFRKGLFAEALIDGITKAGQQLKTHFPYLSDDSNELPDEISFG